MDMDMDMNSDAKPHFRWVEVDLDTGEFPRNAFRVGRERTGEDVYLGRAYYDTDLLPAKVIPENRVAYISFGSREIVINRCQVLLTKVDFDWKYAKDGHVPENAFDDVGQTESGERLYAGRVEYNNCVIPGKIHPSEQCCYFTYSGKELKASEYECLIQNCHFKPYKTYKWKELNLPGQEFPMNVLRAGRDLGGEDIYLGRARRNGDLLPAKVVATRREAYVPYGNDEVRVTNLEVLLMRTYFDWRWAKDGHLPDNAFKVGLAGNGEALYVGRVAHEGTITPGKIQPSHGCCYYSFNGEELKATEYECLVHRQVCFE